MSEEKTVTTEEFLASVFEQAIAERASDVHFEPTVDSVRIRFRVDGVLEDRWKLPTYQLEPIINSLKVLANLDITTHEVPQDGHFEFYQAPSSDEQKGKESGKGGEGFVSSFAERFKEVFSEKKAKQGGGDATGQDVAENRTPKGQRVLDVRVSVYPSVNGQVLVARILNRADALLSLTELGMTPDTLATVRSFIARDSGMVLVTGPAGSGKTTTLYSLILELQSQEKNIMTIEDPVEFHLEGLRQSELKPERGFTFNMALRSILRQDPDVIMVGEIRDQEAAENAISVSLIGRIVGTTVHSNSAIGTVARFIDMNIERSMIAYAINGIISIRLVRKICQSCTAPYKPDPAHLAYFGLSLDGQAFFRGKGCEKCRNTGYLGRVGIFEVLPFDSELRSLIIGKAPMSELETYMSKDSTKTLKYDAINKVIIGQTTLEEINKFV